MTRIKVIFAVLCVGLTLLWLDADRVWLRGYSFNQTRLSLLNYSGIIAMGVLAVSLMLALRSTASEPYVGGLDKSYRLHKWLGVAALVMIIFHWLWVLSRRGSYRWVRRLNRSAHRARLAPCWDRRYFEVL